MTQGIVSIFLLIATTSGCAATPDDRGNLQTLVDRLANDSKECAASEAVKAHSRLKELEINAFPVLIRNVNDKRPACGRFQRQTINRTTVGEVCLDIVSMQVERYSYSKDGPTYLTHDKVPRWWDQNAGKTLPELQLDALSWTVTQIETDDRYKHQRESRLPALRKVLAELRREVLSDKPQAGDSI